MSRYHASKKFKVFYKFDTWVKNIFYRYSGKQHVFLGVTRFYRDKIFGGQCTFDDEDGANMEGGEYQGDGKGLPNEDCIFVPDGDNSNIYSSIMAAPFLASVSDSSFVAS